MKSLIGNFFYRPEIDGLRALAIIMVLFYHAGFSFPGGYIGVDTFFVISGYLITSLIWRDLEFQTFSFTDFWVRRARRIGPAMFVLVISVIIAGWFILLHTDFRSLGNATVAQALFSANIFNFLDGGYFGGNSLEKPLLHMWSLAVEEQFYFLVPFLLWLFFKYFPHKTKSISKILTIGIICSLAYSIYSVTRWQTQAFYLLPSRAWEMLIGSLIAFIPPIKKSNNQRLYQEILSIIGLILILIPAFIYSEETIFPGVTALPPVIGIALIILANKRDKDDPIPTVIGKFFSHKILVFIGAISYSLYLWHWPLFAYSNYWLLEPLSVELRIALMVLSFILGILSWKFIETPFRKQQIAEGKKILSWTIIALSSLLVIGTALEIKRGFPKRLPDKVVEYAKFRFDKSFRNEMNLNDITSGNLPVLGIQSDSILPSLLVWGDSHAMSLMEAVHLYLEKRGLSGVAATHSSTAPLLNGWYLKTRVGLNAQSVPFNNAIEKHIYKHNIKNVLICCFWPNYIKLSKDANPNLDSALLETVKLLSKKGVSTSIFLAVPDHQINIPKALARGALSGYDITSLLSTPKDVKQLDGFSDKFIEELTNAGANILNIKSNFLSMDKSHYIVEKDGKPLYFDKHHLSTFGARTIALPFLDSSLVLVE